MHWWAVVCLVVVMLGLVSVPAGARQDGDGDGDGDADAEAPSHAAFDCLENVRYGPHERNVFDLWTAEETPAPLVLYIHGGGFRSGDKRTLNPELLRLLLEANVAVAAVNYRLTDAAPFPAQMHDIARALQFIRAHAAEYGIDPRLVAATGGSAGAGISQWLLFHDDLADTDAEDFVARQSTSLVCAAVFNAQTSYDPRLHMEMFDSDNIHPAMIPFFGMQSPQDVHDPKFHPLFEESSPINFLREGAGPVMLIYNQPDTDLGLNPSGAAYIHHPMFGHMLKEKADELGVECVVKRVEDDPDRPAFQRRSQADAAEFMIHRLRAARNAQ